MGKMKKKRRLEEVYNATLEINEAEITAAVMSGNYPMQGSVSVDGMDNQTKMTSSQVDKGVSKSGRSQKSVARVGLGTCNMCFATCSSCFHNDQAVIRLKNEKCSSETCRENVFSYSVKVASTLKNRKCETGQHSASEASIVISANSSHDSLSENNLKGFRGFEGNGDNVSCISGADGPTTVSSGKEKSSELIFRSQLGGKMPDCPSEYINPFLTNIMVSNTLCGKESTFCISGDAQDMKLGTVGVNPKPEMKHNVKLEANDGAIPAGLATEGLSSLQQTNEFEKVRELLVLPVAKETSIQSLPTEALNSAKRNHVNNESEIEEDDQVCDTCGDIGREYLLVVCCRCSDGAEHTYCMSKKLDKVPEGGWMCQECKMEERNRIKHAKDLARFKHAKKQNLAKRKNSFDFAQGSTNSVEKVKGSSVTRPRQCSTAGTKSDPCQKCGDAKVLDPDVLTAGNSKEVKAKCNKLKSEIEAAQSKTTRMYRNDVSTLNSKCEVLSHNQLSISSNSRNLIADDKVLKEGLATVGNLNANYTEPPTATCADTVNSWIVDGLPNLSIDRISNLMDLPNQAFELTSLLTNTAFPEFEYIWQGCFEVHKGEKFPDLYDGLQAHLSSCASPRVIETMNNFPHKVLLNEVPRLSTWPIQFVETGVREDHIGLYFFAKDYESYVKCYKNVVERMMKYDLAFKGNVDGAEILIFPSNQLPENSQCWNMMFFLWGVFKGKRVCQQQGNDSWMEVSTPQYIPTAIMSSPENILSLVPIDREELGSPMDVVSGALTDMPPPPLLPAKTCCGTNSSPDLPNVTCLNLTVEQPEYKSERILLPSIPECPPQSWPEVRLAPSGKNVGIAGNLFPLNPFPVKNVHVGDSSNSWNGEELQQEKVPNLELALGEVIPMKESRHDQALVRESTEAEEDVTAAISLSLSLSR